MPGSPCPVLEDGTAPPALPVVVSYVVDSRETELGKKNYRVSIASPNAAIGSISSERA